MTQKELLYVEDAINHEDTMIAYLNDLTNTLTDDDLISFINDEIKRHKMTKKKIYKTLESKENE